MLNVARYIQRYIVEYLPEPCDCWECTPEASFAHEYSILDTGAVCNPNPSLSSL